MDERRKETKGRARELTSFSFFVAVAACLLCGNLRLEECLGRHAEELKSERERTRAARDGREEELRKAKKTVEHEKAQKKAAQARVKQAEAVIKQLLEEEEGEEEEEDSDEG